MVTKTRPTTPKSLVKRPGREPRWRLAVWCIASAFAAGAVASCSPAPNEPSQVPTGALAPTASSAATTATQPATMSRETWLSNYWQGEGDPPKPLPVIREVTREESGEAQRVCMEEQGWIDVSKDPEVTEIHVPEGQTQAYEVAWYQCNAQYPWAPKYYQPYNDKQLRALYDHSVGDLTACIKEQGHTVPDPPSFEKFVADYRNQSPDRWDAYGAVPAAKVNEVGKVCPMEPEGFFDLATVPNG